MRLRAPSRGLALSAALLLSLTACNSGSPEEDGSASPTTTAPASASDGGSSDGSGSEGSESEESEEGSGDGSAEPSESESSDAESTEAGDDGDGGEYVPASKDGPAKNVPKPEMPEAMKEENEEGAKAAVQYWWDTVYYLQQTGDAELVKSVSSTDCQYCTRYVGAIEKVYEAGGWHSGSKPEVTSAIHWPMDSDKDEVTILLNTGTADEFTAEGETVPEVHMEEATEKPWIFHVAYDAEAGSWIVKEAIFHRRGE